MVSISLYFNERLMLRLLRIDAIEIGDRFSVECYRRLLRIDAIEIGDRFSVEVHISLYFYAKYTNAIMRENA